MFSIYGHCSSYRINAVLRRAQSLPQLEVADSYVAGRESSSLHGKPHSSHSAHQQQQQQQHSALGKKRKVSLFRGFVVLRVRSSHDDDSNSAALGIFSNGAVVSFGLERSAVLEVMRLFRDCEQQDGVLFPARRGWNERPPEERLAAPLEITAVQEFNYTTINSLPQLGFDVPSEVEELSQQLFDDEQSGSQAAGASSASSSSNSMPPFIGYFAADSLSAIVVPAATVEAQLPFMHALAESVEVEALSATLAPIALRARTWREALENGEHQSRALSRIASAHEVRTTYLQALRLAALCVRLTGRSGVFWTQRHAPQRITYECAYEHLEVSKRLALVQRQLEACNVTVAYMGEQLRIDTDERLEWMVTLLIVVTLLHQVTEL